MKRSRPLSSNDGDDSPPRITTPGDFTPIPDFIPERRPHMLSERRRLERERRRLEREELMHREAEEMRARSRRRDQPREALLPLDDVDEQAFLLEQLKERRRLEELRRAGEPFSVAEEEDEEVSDAPDSSSSSSSSNGESRRDDHSDLIDLEFDGYDNDDEPAPSPAPAPTIVNVSDPSDRLAPPRPYRPPEGFSLSPFAASLETRDSVQERVRQANLVERAVPMLNVPAALTVQESPEVSSEAVSRVASPLVFEHTVARMRRVDFAARQLRAEVPINVRRSTLDMLANEKLPVSFAEALEYCFLHGPSWDGAALFATLYDRAQEASAEIFAAFMELIGEPQISTGPSLSDLVTWFDVTRTDRLNANFVVHELVSAVPRLAFAAGFGEWPLDGPLRFFWRFCEKIPRITKMNALKTANFYTDMDAYYVAGMFARSRVRSASVIYTTVSDRIAREKTTPLQIRRLLRPLTALLARDDQDTLITGLFKPLYDKIDLCVLVYEDEQPGLTFSGMAPGFSALLQRLMTADHVRALGSARYTTRVGERRIDWRFLSDRLYQATADYLTPFMDMGRDEMTPLMNTLADALPWNVKPTEAAIQFVALMVSAYRRVATPDDYRELVDRLYFWMHLGVVPRHLANTHPFTSATKGPSSEANLTRVAMAAWARADTTFHPSWRGHSLSLNSDEFVPLWLVTAEPRDLQQQERLRITGTPAFFRQFISQNSGTSEKARFLFNFLPTLVPAVDLQTAAVFYAFYSDHVHFLDGDGLHCVSSFATTSDNFALFDAATGIVNVDASIASLRTGIYQRNGAQQAIDWAKANLDAQLLVNLMGTANALFDHFNDKAAPLALDHVVSILVKLLRVPGVVVAALETISGFANTFTALSRKGSLLCRANSGQPAVRVVRSIVELRDPYMPLIKAYNAVDKAASPDQRKQRREKAKQLALQSVAAAMR